MALTNETRNFYGITKFISYQFENLAERIIAENNKAANQNHTDYFEQMSADNIKNQSVEQAKYLSKWDDAHREAQKEYEQANTSVLNLQASYDAYKRVDTSGMDSIAFAQHQQQMADAERLLHNAQYKCDVIQKQLNSQTMQYSFKSREEMDEAVDTMNIYLRDAGLPPMRYESNRDAGTFNGQWVLQCPSVYSTAMEKAYESAANRPVEYYQPLAVDQHARQDESWAVQAMARNPILSVTSGPNMPGIDVITRKMQELDRIVTGKAFEDGREAFHSIVVAPIAHESVRDSEYASILNNISNADSKIDHINSLYADVLQQAEFYSTDFKNNFDLMKSIRNQSEDDYNNIRQAVGVLNTGNDVRDFDAEQYARIVFGETAQNGIDKATAEMKAKYGYQDVVDPKTGKIDFEKSEQIAYKTLESAKEKYSSEIEAEKEKYIENALGGHSIDDLNELRAAKGAKKFSAMYDKDNSGLTAVDLNRINRDLLLANKIRLVDKNGNTLFRKNGSLDIKRLEKSGIKYMHLIGKDGNPMTKEEFELLKKMGQKDAGYFTQNIGKIAAYGGGFIAKMSKEDQDYSWANEIMSATRFGKNTYQTLVEAKKLAASGAGRFEYKPERLRAAMDRAKARTANRRKVKQTKHDLKKSNSKPKIISDEKIKGYAQKEEIRIVKEDRFQKAYDSMKKRVKEQLKRTRLGRGVLKTGEKAGNMFRLINDISIQIHEMLAKLAASIIPATAEVLGIILLVLFGVSFVIVLTSSIAGLLDADAVDKTVIYHLYEDLKMEEDAWLDSLVETAGNGTLWEYRYDFRYGKYYQYSDSTSVDWMGITTVTASGFGKYISHLEHTTGGRVRFEADGSGVTGKVYMNPFDFYPLDKNNVEKEASGYDGGSSLTLVANMTDNAHDANNNGIIEPEEHIFGAKGGGHTSNIKDILCMMDIAMQFDTTGSGTLTSSVTQVNLENFFSEAVTSIKAIGLGISTIWDGEALGKWADCVEGHDTVSYYHLVQYCTGLFEASHQEAVEIEIVIFPLPTYAQLLAGETPDMLIVEGNELMVSGSSDDESSRNSNQGNPVTCPGDPDCNFSVNINGTDVTIPCCQKTENAYWFFDSGAVTRYTDTAGNEVEISVGGIGLPSIGIAGYPTAEERELDKGGGAAIMYPVGQLGNQSGNYGNNTVWFTGGNCLHGLSYTDNGIGSEYMYNAIKEDTCWSETEARHEISRTGCAISTPVPVSRYEYNSASADSLAYVNGYENGGPIFFYKYDYAVVEDGYSTCHDTDTDGDGPDYQCSNHGNANGSCSHSVMTYAMAIYRTTYTRNCKGHCVYYCGGHLKANLYGRVYSFSQDQINAAENGCMDEFAKIDAGAIDYSNARMAAETDCLVDGNTHVGCRTDARANLSFLDCDVGLVNIAGLNINVFNDNGSFYNTQDWKMAEDTKYGLVGANIYRCNDIFDVDLCILYGWGLFPIGGSLSSTGTTYKDFVPWTGDNMFLAVNKFRMDWDEIYGFDIPINLGYSVLSDKEIEAIIESVTAAEGDTLSDMRRRAIETALRAVGAGSYSQEHHGHAYLYSPCNVSGITSVEGRNHCTITDCSGFASFVWLQTARELNEAGDDGIQYDTPLHGNIGYTETFKSIANGTVWDGNNAQPGDILVKSAPGDTAGIGGNHALVYIGKANEDIELDNGLIIQAGKPITVDCTTIDEGGNIYLRNCYSSTINSSYHMDISVLPESEYIQDPSLGWVYVAPLE